MTGAICWHSQRESWDCPQCRARGDDGKLIAYGRCRSGRRWFWAVSDWDSGASRHGWDATEDGALAAARTVVTALASDAPALAYPWHGLAERELRAVNAAKRRERPASGGAEPGHVEYLYGTRHYWPDDGYGTEIREVVPFRITRKTPRRVYYIRHEHGPGDVETGFVDRQALERDGDVRNRGTGRWEDDSRLFASRELAEAHLGIGGEPAAATPDLRELRQAMAAAHPDRGGSNEEFIAARARYEKALPKGPQ